MNAFPDARRFWRLDPAVAQLNNGGFGTTPIVVQQEQQRWRDEIERNPTDFYVRRLHERLADVRTELAEFLGADESGLVFVDNATAGVQTALAWLAPSLAPGDEVLTTDHCYHAVAIQLRLLAERTGARVVVATLPMPVPDENALVDAVLEATTARTRAIVVDHVTSPTAIVLPVARIVAECRSRGITSIVDGAHAPGLLPLQLRDVDADVYAGNLHKWLGAPKTAAVLYVRAEHRDTVRPVVASHRYDEGLVPAFDVMGTRDVTPVLAAPAALRFFGDLGWDAVRRHNRELAGAGAALVAAALGTALPVPDALATAMRVVPLGCALDRETGLAVGARLHDEFGIEVPLMGLGESVDHVRVAAQIYNTIDDYARLADALPGVLAAAAPAASPRPAQSALRRPARSPRRELRRSAP